MNSKRVAAMKAAMKKHHATSLVLSDPSSIFYLTGHWFSPGERFLALLIPLNKEPLLFLNELFPCPKSPGVTVKSFPDTVNGVALLAEEIDGPCIAVDKEWPAKFLLDLMDRKKEAQFILATPIADAVRRIKDAKEQDQMRVASHLNDQAMCALWGHIDGTQSEEEVTSFLHQTYKKLGTEGPSFTAIVAYGANGSDPHHETDESHVTSGDSIILDIGCKKDSYCSDMTRTVFYREVSPEARKVYEIVQEANRQGILAARVGNRFSDVDRAAREVIERAGYGPYFTHRTGHGIGIDVHEPGDVSQVNDQIIEEGMIFSVEPGIYLPGKFGVRIEDLVLITKDGNEVLNQVPKELTILCADPDPKEEGHS
ncbi:Aminopeptidase YpdF (MP-, MA-, MS-, AP-, NP- specific) [Clostridiaceae bacterium JG1575]|nr:Aminopeptidase YpdF (MP-, MA-, MS-, AP-, NP- specific) [Clostridiaceae bacterium JG1575]